jgi:uncharacterized membrane-anchored protein
MIAMRPHNRLVRRRAMGGLRRCESAKRRAAEMQSKAIRAAMPIHKRCKVSVKARLKR